MKKFNKFDTVYNTALDYLIKEENALDSSVYNKGLKVGSKIRLKPNFFTQSDAIKSFDENQIKALKEINSRQYDKCQHYFLVKTNNRQTVGPNVKNANDTNSGVLDYGVVSAAEKDNNLYKFIIPSTDAKYVEILDFGDNLAPLLSPVTPYSYVDSERGKPTPVNDKDFASLDNSPKDRSLRTR